MNRRRSLAALAALALLVTLPATPVGAANSKDTGKADVYLVQLAEEPAVAYMGNIAGYARTAPATGRKFNSASVASKRYAAYLSTRHNAILAAAGVSKLKKIYSYSSSVNGFAAVLTGTQAAKIRAMRGVLLVHRDLERHMTTDSSPEFLGLTGSGGLWSQLGGQGRAGEDVIVGVIDTGVWPEHPSFSDQRDLLDRPGESGKRLRVYGPPPSYWHGTCQSGERWSQDDCNNKIIGARYFLAGFGHHGIVKSDFKSARDSEGHGTHTASTAAGNANVRARVFGIDRGLISGMAPRARIAVYKGLWNTGTGFSSDLAMAIDAAVADGVDVINYSIGSDTPDILGVDDIAFLNATTRGGVFASVSAGNAGPGAGTIGSPSADPWVTTVGANTQTRAFLGRVQLGNGTSYTGTSITRGTPVLPLVDGKAAGSQGCFAGELNPAVVSGKIVLCEGGVNRVFKSHEVLRAGGRGMILYGDFETQWQASDSHWVPTTHIRNSQGLEVRAYITAAGAGARAQIFQGEKGTWQGSKMASFSSRGPNEAASDIIKPDVTAPGVHILAGQSPRSSDFPQGELFQAIGGTSMSAPHVAGLAALLVQAHRDWTPAQIKSAFMTTGRQNVFKEDGTTPADPFDMGGGHVVPTTANDPGLVFDVSRNQYLQFLCGNGSLPSDHPVCVPPADGGLGPIDPSELNLASIGVNDLAGTRTVRRTAKSVLAAGSSWTRTIEGLDGFTVTGPTSLTFGTGAAATQSFDVTFERTSAPLDEWTFGAIKWTQSGGGRVVRMPVALRPVAISAPEVVTGTANAAGSATLEWQAQAGYAGVLSADGFGLAPDAIAAAQFVAQDPDQDIGTGTFTDGVKLYDFEVKATDNTRYWAGGTRDATTTSGSDLDVYLLFDADNNGFTLDDLIAFSADGDSEEIVQLVSPAVGKYRLIVHGWGTPGGSGSTFDLHQWRVNQAAADSGSLVATVDGSDPSTVTVGEVVDVEAVASGLTTAGEYRGVVGYSDGTSQIGETVVIVNKP